MNDKSKGLSTQFNLARIVAKSAWGRSTQTEQGHSWELAHDTLIFS